MSFHEATDAYESIKKSWSKVCFSFYFCFIVSFPQELYLIPTTKVAQREQGATTTIGAIIATNRWPTDKQVLCVCVCVCVHVSCVLWVYVCKYVCDCVISVCVKMHIKTISSVCVRCVYVSKYIIYMCACIVCVCACGWVCCELFVLWVVCVCVSMLYVYVRMRVFINGCRFGPY